MSPTRYINLRQRYWALRHGIPFDNQGHVVELNDNLFMPLSQGAMANFQAGAGGELKNNMFALHSSSGLVVNFFDYWRLYSDFRPIVLAVAPALVNSTILNLTFEAQAPINWPVHPQVRITPPHLDVIIEYKDQAQPQVLKAIAIESKFQELYNQNQGDFADRYIVPGNAAMWEGLEPLQEIAVQIHDHEVLYDRLKVSQLIKHCLGLKARFGIPNFDLVYLWYEAPGPQAELHRREVRRFKELMDECKLTFRSYSYLDLIDSLAASHREKHGAYIDYLLERYF
jgi:hypothetical protein